MAENVQGTDFIQQLLDFRTTYVRGVARATVDLEFRRVLTEPGGNPLRVLHEVFGYTCPFDLTLVLQDLVDRGPRVNPANGVVMTLPYYGESITVYIPKRPSGDPRVQMDALAAYYHENAWFLHSKGHTGGLPRLPGPPGGAPGTVLGTIKSPPPINLPPIAQPQWASVAMAPDRNTRFDMGDNFDKFISFAAAIFNAVALTWRNDLFLHDLTSYTAEGDQPRKTTIQILDDWLGYKYPWQLDLTVQVDPTATYDSKAGKWENTTPPVIMLTLPWMTGAYAPGMDTAAAARREVAENNAHPEVAIMGLALYNTDGPGYPFTCG
jgi:ribosomally synthesized peptide (two-chain TOMM family)